MCTKVPAADSGLSAVVDAPAAAPTRRNFVLGILNGTVGAVAMDFMHPELILGGLIYALTESPMLVALVTIINKAGALVPQLFVSGHAEHLPRKRPIYVIMTVVRAAAGVGLVLAIWMLARGVNPMTLGLFFGVFLVAQVSGGSGHVVFLDMTGRLIRHDLLGRFLGLRELVGGSLSLVAGLLVVQRVLERYELPHNYTVLAAVGVVLSTTAMLMLCAWREAPGPRARRRTTLRESVERGMRWLRSDHNYRLYFWLRVAFRVNYMALAFFIPYGAERLTRAGGAVGVAVLGGVLVATFKLSRVLSSLYWGRLADHAGYRSCLVGAGIGFTLAPLLALLAPELPAAFTVGIPLTRVVLDLPLCVFLGALATLGVGFQGSVIGGQRFLIVGAPAHRRISYGGFLNTLTSPLTLLPLAGGLVVRYLGAGTLFVALVGGGVLYLITASRMIPERAAEPDGPSRHASAP